MSINYIFGTDTDDELFGTAMNDYILGLKGNDIIMAGAGNDSVKGGGGNDTIHGEDGNDVLNGGSGRDTLFGDAGNDFLKGGRGSDILTGGAGSDVLKAGNGSDTLVYKPSDAEVGDHDFYHGGRGTDTLKIVTTNEELATIASALGVESNVDDVNEALLADPSLLLDASWWQDNFGLDLKIKSIENVMVESDGPSALEDVCYLNSADADNPQMDQTLVIEGVGTMLEPAVIGEPGEQSIVKWTVEATNSSDASEAIARNWLSIESSALDLNWVADTGPNNFTSGIVLNTITMLFDGEAPVYAQSLDLSANSTGGSAQIKHNTVTMIFDGEGGNIVSPLSMDWTAAGGPGSQSQIQYNTVDVRATQAEIQWSATNGPIYTNTFTFGDSADLLILATDMDIARNNINLNDGADIVVLHAGDSYKYENGLGFGNVIDFGDDTAEDMLVLHQSTNGGTIRIQNFTQGDDQIQLSDFGFVAGDTAEDFVVVDFSTGEGGGGAITTINIDGSHRLVLSGYADGISFDGGSGLIMGVV